MNAERRREVAEIVGVAAIVVTLIFLALEIRQNSELMRAQSRTEMAQDTVALLTLHVNDTEFLDVWIRGNAGEELTEIERTQFANTYYGWIWHWNNLEYLHREGLYDETEYAAQIAIVRSELQQYPGFKTFWCSEREGVASPQLIASIEERRDGDLCAD